MQTLNYCIQCKTDTGEIGSFGYSGRTESGALVPCTPVFESLQEFYNWAHLQGWIGNNTHDISKLHLVKEF